MLHVLYFRVDELEAILFLLQQTWQLLGCLTNLYNSSFHADLVFVPITKKTHFNLGHNIHFSDMEMAKATKL